MSTVVSCKQLNKIYQQGMIEVRALSDINLDVEAGDFICLSGPSGSGKSTLLNMIGGLDSPSSGEIIVDGERVDLMNKSELAELRLNKIGFVFQAYNLIPVLTAKENVEMVMQMQGDSPEYRNQHSLAILKEVGLEGLENRKPSELSGGQQQRVAVARAIVDKPCLVLADEPTANLDSKNAENLLQLMRDMGEQHKMTFIVSTHDPLVMARARRLIKLHDGKIIENNHQG